MSASLLDFSCVSARRASITRLAAALAVLQILFPPKSWNNGFMAQSIGHSFIFSDPMSGVNQMAGGMATTSINWMQLVIQIAITAGLAFGAIKYFETKGA